MTSTIPKLREIMEGWIAEVERVEARNYALIKESAELSLSLEAERDHIKTLELQVSLLRELLVDAFEEGWRKSAPGMLITAAWEQSEAYGELQQIMIGEEAV